jgi:hypothetical protein
MKRHVYSSEHVVWAIKRENRTKTVTCGLDEETDEKKERKKSQNCEIWPPRGGATFQPILTKFCMFVHVTEVIKPAKCGFENVNSIRLPAFIKRGLPYRNAYGLYNSAKRYRAGLW